MKKLILAILILSAISVCAEKKDPVKFTVSEYRNGKLKERHYIYPDNAENNRRIKESGPVNLWTEYNDNGAVTHRGYPSYMLENRRLK